MKEQKHEGKEACCASYGVEAIPFVEQYRSLLGTNVEVGVGQLLVCGEDDKECEGNEEADQQTSNQDLGPATLKPGADRREEPHDGETRLHHRTTAIARTPLFNRRGRARFETSRMFDQVNVDRGTGEETGAESGDQLEEHESEYNVGMRLAPPNGSRLSCGRNAWGRKEFEPQTRRLASEATQFFPTCERPPASSAC